MIAQTKYRFRLVSGADSTYVNPLGVVNISWTLIEGTYYYQQNVGAFDLSGVDYNWLKAIETAGNICTDIFVEVERKCTGAWELYARSKFTVQSCAWINSKCKVTVNPEATGGGNCLLEKGDDVINIIGEIPLPGGADGTTYMSLNDGSGGDPGYNSGRVFLYNDAAFHQVLIKPVLDEDGNPTPDPTLEDLMGVGVIAEVERDLIRITKLGVVTCGLFCPEWKIFVAWAYRRSEAKVGGECPETPPLYTLIDDTDVTYCFYQKRPTEEDMTMFPGLSVIGACPIIFPTDSDTIYSGAVANDDYPFGFCAYLSHKDQDYNYLTIALETAMNIFLEKCDVNMMVSDFFQINPINISTTNYVTGDPTKVNDIRFIQKSNAIFPFGSEATVGEMSFNDLTGVLKEAFQCYWTIDVNGNLRVEHYSFFETTLIGLDLTTGDFTKFTNQKIDYNYKKELLPFIEKVLQSEWHNYNFDEREIKYVDPDGNKLGCVGDSELDHSLGLFTTDLDFYVEYPTNVPRDGWVMIAVETPMGGNPNVIIEDGLYNLNGHLSIKRLVDRYYRHGRSNVVAQVNGIDTTFETSVRLRQEEGLAVPLCCDNEFSPDFNVKTPNGTGRVTSAEHDLTNNKITLTIEYP